MVFELQGTAGAVDLRSHFLRPGERDRWRTRYVRRLLVTDIAVVSAAVLLAQFGTLEWSKSWAFDWEPHFQGRHTAISVAIVLAWLAFLSASDTRSPRVIGTGGAEYRKLVSSSLHLFGLIAIVSLTMKFDLTRNYLSIALPLGLLGLVLTRFLWRRHAARRRAVGGYQRSVLVVGSAAAARSMAMAFSRHQMFGYHVVGVCVSDRPEDAGRSEIEVGGRTIPIVGDDRSVVRAARRTGADTVAVMATDHLGPQDIRTMAWDLHAFGAELIVAPGVFNISETRMTSQLLAGMPMLHIEKPQYDRAMSIRKAIFDILFATVALIFVAPIMIAIAAAVKFTSKGPVFYLSERIGVDGKPFRMIKFRSMQADAERQVGALIDGANPLFFKMKQDPRVTPVGQFLRKYSLDELPQFFNVLRRDMSVVGPRPQVRREVHSYDGIMRRRLLVKPGVTGLWQVSGRSDLTPAESVELDLSYVENWSMSLDVGIIVKTVNTVARGDGAY